MSDAMLHAVLQMPPALWQDTELDRRQRHARYVEASRRIEAQQAELDRCAAALTVLSERMAQMTDELTDNGKKNGGW